MNPSSESSDLDLSGMRILVVEDSWQVGIVITRLLKALGAEMGPVATSADAQRLVCKQPAHAALVDFRLRGGELARGIERLYELGVYVIVTTGYTEPAGSSLIAVSVPTHRASRVAPPGSPGSAP